MLDKENSFKKVKKIYNSGSCSYTYYFYCQCGEEIRAQSSALKKHSGKCASCSQKGKPYQAIYTELLKSKNDNNFTLTYDQFIEIIKNNRCTYCDIELYWYPHTKFKGKEISGSRAYQLDKKDPSKGYSMENAVPCCWLCNKTKSDAFTYEEFLEIGILIKKFRSTRLLKYTKLIE